MRGNEQLIQTSTSFVLYNLIYSVEGSPIGIKLMPMKYRKVSYRLDSAPYEFDPDRTERQESEYADGKAEKTGCLHGWTEIPSSDAVSGKTFIELHGVVETEDGSVVAVPYHAVRFIDTLL